MGVLYKTVDKAVTKKNLNFFLDFHFLHAKYNFKFRYALYVIALLIKTDSLD